MNKSVCFTICSINYLAQAKTLGDSLQQTNPESEFRVYLVDKLSGREEITNKIPYALIEVEKLQISEFQEMVSRYNLIELNTAVKPFIIDKIFKDEPDIQHVFYFDPDIILFNSLHFLKQKLSKYSTILTPHAISPSDGHPLGQPEVNYLSTGIFNLGFVAFSRREESLRILDWWKEKLANQGYMNHQLHLFYDQKWMNLAPIFFDNVYIEKNVGYNVAGWNLHERFITLRMNVYYVNEVPLVFYHFSGVDVEGTNVSLYSKFQVIDRPDIADILATYRRKVLANGYSYFKEFTCSYTKVMGETPQLQEQSNYHRIRGYIRKLVHNFSCL